MRAWSTVIGANEQVRDIKPKSIAYFWSVVLLLTGSPPLAAETNTLVSNIAIHIDRQDSDEQTPIMRQYLSLIGSAGPGDEIILLQKYFRNAVLNQAIVNAAARGTKVTAVYRDELRPSCEELLPDATAIDCSTIFVRKKNVHHKSMVLHRKNGSTAALIGSFNLRERDTESPRAHTALSFDIEFDNALFDFYKAYANGLLGLPVDVNQHLSIAIIGGGKLSLTFHPGDQSVPLETLNKVAICDGPLWLSYYHAAPDALGKPVFERLAELAKQGCDVRFLLDRNRDNQDAARQLRSLGIATHYPNERDGEVTLGHKLLLVHSNGQLLLSQSSANLDCTSHHKQYNLTLQLQGDFPRIRRLIEDELLRYW